MNYYLRVNEEAISSLPVIAHFAEDFLVDEGYIQLTLGIKVEDPALTDAMSTKLMGYCVDNAISILSVIDEEGAVIYTTKKYTEADELSLNMNLEQVQDDDDFGLNTPTSYSLTFRTK